MDRATTYAHEGGDRQAHGGLQSVHAGQCGYEGVRTNIVSCIGLTNRESRDGAASLNDMKDMLANLPQYQEQREKVDQ